jgi:hypothetical protein
MLLRSVTKHVKDQNWFAVALDFVIVVVGILIAFQITNWSESQRDRAKERQIIERLYSDFEALSGEVSEKIEFLESIVHHLDSLDTLFVDYPKSADLKQLRNFYESAFSLPSMAGQSDTYEQLIANGDMNLLTNNLLQEQLVTHKSLTAELTHNDRAVREWSRPYLLPIVRLYPLINAMPLDQAISEAGSKADMIIAISMYKRIFAQQLELLNRHKESFTKLTEMLALEKRL